MTTLHVSLLGNDSWSGLLSEPNTSGDDGPMRSLEAAQAAVRRHKAAMTTPGEIRVLLRGGRYELSQPWILGAQDSGFPRATERLAQTWPVIWSAYPGETPVLSGGRRITGAWQRHTVHGHEAWTIELPEVSKGGWNFRQLWVNGERRRRPCLPKQGLWQVDRIFDADFKNFWLNAGSTRFGFKAGELDATWRNLHDVELQFFGWWNAPRVGLASVDALERIATFDRNSMLRLGYAEGDGVDYRVENIAEALSEPGEWYLDRPSGRLTYLPLAGEDLATAEIIAPRLESLLRLDGAAHLRFEGLVFAHNEWQPPGHFADSIQAAYEVPGAVNVQRGDDCVFRRCRIEHTSSYGVVLEHGTIDTSFDRCELRDLGAGGIKIWHGCRRNIVVDCEISDGGLVWAAGVGVLIGRATGNRVEHNHIHDFFYSGVSAGWNWGYTESDSYGNLIEWNHIHDLGKGLLSDMGGIYLLGHAAGTRLRFNHIHDIACRRYGAWCIYTDEGSSEVLIEGNTCYNSNENAFNQHYGRNNQIRGNIFAYGQKSVISYGKPEPHLGMVLEGNIFLAHGTPIARDTAPSRWAPAQGAFHGNLYWCEDGPVTFHRGGAGVFATQAFPHGYLAEAARFAPLGDIPLVAASPQEVDWQRARVWQRFYDQAGTAEAPTGSADLRALLDGSWLVMRARFTRPPMHEPLTGPLWAREHLEVFLAPRADSLASVQFGLASNGEIAEIWHNCDVPTKSDWQAIATSTATGWQATLRIPLDAIARMVGSTAPSWRFLAGFSTVSAVADWADWQQQGHDPAGVVADPLFVDPGRGNFQLRPGSPALALGFVPVDTTRCGRRKPQ